ncbi:MAG: UTP--glucose-1-phosphate uridylyltransferase [Candidatus Wildermuthbacteria bacterium]|nr:UTP--glucose-1-phosphate uridylyltransferase [Candidatus Wildermuthbacteria bacterium]
MITKAIIPLAGLATRHLPLSKVLPKEFLPLGDKPLLHYVVQEAKEAGAEDIIFVVSSNRKIATDYFKKAPQLEKILEEKKQVDFLESLSEVEKLANGLTFSYVIDKPLGDGHAVLQARKLIGEEPCFVLYADDIVEAATPCASQLAQVFRTSEKPILALFELPVEKLSSYGVVAAEKMANRLYKIKNIIEKPPKNALPSRLAIMGRSIITPEVFDYLKKAKPNKKGEISLTETFGQMVKDGKIIYGHQCEGRWWECGNKEDWLKSFVYFAAKHPQFGKEVRKFMREEKLI